MAGSNEETKSLIRSENCQNEKSLDYRDYLEYASCLLVAFPTAVLNGLAAVSSDSTQLSELNSPADLGKLLKKASAGRIAYGTVALIASEAVLFFLNKRYFLSSLKESLDLLKRVVGVMIRCCHREFGVRQEVSISEVLLFVCSLATSLIFSEIGGKALLFLGVPGKTIGFSLSFLVYFSTRFASAKMFMTNMHNEEQQLEQEHLDELSLPQPILRRLASTAGYTLVGLTIVPIGSSFLPQSVQGIESLTGTSFGRKGDYQNAASFSFGIFATALTVFFYELNIKDLPKHFIKTALSIYQEICAGRIKNAMKLLGYTLLAFGASFLTGIGFKLVAVNAIASGYLSYLGSWLERFIPDGLLVGVVSMLWSHLQELINKTENVSPVFFRHPHGIFSNDFPIDIADRETALLGDRTPVHDLP